MPTELFDFDLPSELIAQHPIRPRDAARLLVIHQTGCEDRRVSELPELLRAGDLLVFNDARVLPVRLYGKRGEAGVEVTLFELEGPTRWRALARPARKCRPGDVLSFAPDLVSKVVATGEAGEVTLDFGCEGARLGELLERYGAMPLPPYIRRPRGGDPRDREDYQTLFARREGAVLYLPAGPAFTLSGEIRNVVTAVAKTYHYWLEHARG